jgi:ParB/RepB/Spo0J family partition protein
LTLSQTGSATFEDVLPVLLEAFRDFVRSQQGGAFRIHARKFGAFIRSAVKASGAQTYAQLARDQDFMEGNDHLAGLALSRLADAENSVIVPVQNGNGEEAPRAGVGFIYEFSPGAQIGGPGAVLLSRVRPPRVAIRYVGDITRMMGSVKNEGQHVPMVVRPCGEGSHEYEIVDGFTRFRAIDCLGYLQKVKVVVEELSDGDAVKRALTLNMVRYQMNDLEQAKTFAMIVDSGWATVKSLAASIGYSEDYVRARLELIKAPPEIQERVARRDISMERALSFSRLVQQEKIDRTQATQIIDKSAEMRLSQRQITETVGEVSGSKVSVDQAITSVLEKSNRTLSRERRTVIATRSTHSFRCEHGTEYEVDWDRAKIWKQSTLSEFSRDF